MRQSQIRADRKSDQNGSNEIQKSKVDSSHLHLVTRQVASPYVNQKPCLELLLPTNCRSFAVYVIEGCREAMLAAWAIRWLHGLSLATALDLFNLRSSSDHDVSTKRRSYIEELQTTKSC